MAFKMMILTVMIVMTKMNLMKMKCLQSQKLTGNCCWCPNVVVMRAGCDSEIFKNLIVKIVVDFNLEQKVALYVFISSCLVLAKENLKEM